MKNEKIELNVQILKQLFYNNDYGIYVAKITKFISDTDPSSIRYDDEFDRTIIIQGNMEKLSMRDERNIVCELQYSKKYKSYSYVTSLVISKAIETEDEIKAFLLTVLTAKEYEVLSNVYPVLELIDRISDDQIDTSLTKGIKESKMAKIKEKILANIKYQKAIVELCGTYGLDQGMVIKLSDKFGSPDLLLEKIKENPYILTTVDGYGFKKADDIALKMGIPKDSMHRLCSAVYYVLTEQEDKGHIWVSDVTAINEVAKLTNQSIDLISKAIKENNSFYNYENNRVYLKRLYYQEQEIKSNLLRILKAKNLFSKASKDDVDKYISEVEVEQGFPYTEEQRLAIHTSINENIVVINGKAGTGKTSVIKGVVGVYKKLNNELTYTTCALSGKASQRIQESTGLQSSTIHRLLRIGMEDSFGIDNPLKQKVIVFDEASMVNSGLVEKLLQAIDDGAKLIIAGDTGQLEPIGAGNFLVDILKTKKVPSVELTIVHRQATKSGILLHANDIRDGKNFFKRDSVGMEKLGELKDLFMITESDQSKMISRVLTLAKKFTGNILDFQVLLPMKSRGELSCVNLNNKLQRIFNCNPEDQDSINTVKNSRYTFTEGDKIIFNGNDYNLGIFNGTIGIIKNIMNADDKFELVVDFEGLGDIMLTKECLIQIDLAYAITIHKSQGSQWKFVVMAFDYSSYVLLNKQLVYTGMTRASQALFMIVDKKALAHSARTDNSEKRNTLLKEIL